MSTVTLNYNPPPGGTRLVVVDDAGSPVQCYSNAGRTTTVAQPVTVPAGGVTVYLAVVAAGWTATLTAVADGRTVGTASGSAGSHPVQLDVVDPPGDDVLAGVTDGGTP